LYPEAPVSDPGRPSALEAECPGGLASALGLLHGERPWPENRYPSGQLAQEISGSGTYIDYEWAHITTTPGFCNWRVDYVYRTVYNRVYRRISTATKYGCDMWAYAPTVYPGRVRPGTACAQLYRSGVYVTKQCHSIY
jgi:hypothetical protein